MMSHPKISPGWDAESTESLERARCQAQISVDALTERRHHQAATTASETPRTLEVLTDVGGTERSYTRPGPSLTTHRTVDNDEDVERELKRLRTKREAQRRLSAELRESTATEFPRGIVLTDLLGQSDEAVAFRIAGLLPSGGRVVLSARMKSGKTTSVGNLVRSLADGDDLFDAFACRTVSPGSRVVVIDDEMSEATIKHWLRDQGVKNTDAVAVVPLRGRVETFDILDPDVRGRWVQLLRSLSTEVLVLDCLRPVLDALGLDENHEAGKLLVALDALVAEANICELVLVHHMGHDGERSRGDSRLRDWPDAEWKLVRSNLEDPRAPVFFSAFGRDVDVGEGELLYDAATRRLSFSASSGTRTSVANSAKIKAAVEYVAENPGASTGAIEGALEGDNKAARVAIDQAVTAKLLLRLNKGNAKYHYTPDQARLFEVAERQYQARTSARRET